MAGFTIAFITIWSISLIRAQVLEAVAYGNRVFAIDVNTGDNVVAEGDAVLSIAPSHGILKQSNCIDIVNVNDVISFESQQLVFCYEGGPKMVNEATDTFTFDILQGNGAISILTTEVRGSDPVVAVPEVDRRVVSIKDGFATFAGSNFAFFKEDVTELNEFQIQLEALFPETVATLTDSLGNTLFDGSIINNDEVLTFTAAPGIDICAPLPLFLSPICPPEYESPTFYPYIPSFTFRIIFGEGDDEIIREPLQFFYFIETPVADAELVIENTIISIPTENTNGSTLLFPLNSSLVAVRNIDEEDNEFLLSLSVSVVTSFTLSMIQGSISGTGLESAHILSCSPLNGFSCRITLIGTVEAVTRALDSDFITLVFDVDTIGSSILEIAINRDQEVQEISFQPAGTTLAPSPQPPAPETPTSEPPSISDDSPSNAFIGILITVGILVSFAMISGFVYVVKLEEKDDVKKSTEEEEKQQIENFSL